MNFVDHLAKALLELALHTRTGLQQTNVKRQQRNVFQLRRHVALGETQRKTLHNGSFADTGLASENRVVLPTAHQYVDDLTNLFVASCDRIKLALFGFFGQVNRIFF